MRLLFTVLCFVCLCAGCEVYSGYPKESSDDPQILPKVRVNAPVVTF